MTRFLLAILIIALNACSTEQVKTTDVSFYPSVAPEQAPLKTTLPPLKPHLISHLEEDGYQPTLQEKLLPRLARYIKQGIASWYGPGFHGKKTATGEIFDMYAMTAAHKTLPIPCYAKVTNLENNRSIIVRVNDRGPFVRNRELDLSYAAAKHLDMTQGGTGAIEIKALSPSQALPQLQEIAAAQAQSVYLQIGSFGSAKKALQLKDKITAYDMPEPDIRPSTYRNATLYKVQMGPINSTADANQLKGQLARIGITDTQFVTESKQSPSPRATM